MQVIGLLSWFDEHPAWLAELVASMARAGVDHVVAVDGAYALYPEARGNSGSEQAQVVTSTATGAGMGVTVHLPRWPWVGGELEKRTAMFKLAHAIAEPDTDWLWVCDADEVITDGYVRPMLEQTDLEACEVMMWEQVRVAEHERNTSMIRKLFRAQSTGIHVVDHHARYVTGDGRVLWDAYRTWDQVPGEQVMDVKVQHRPGDRATYRTAKRLRYYEQRESHGIEVG